MRKSRSGEASMRASGTSTTRRFSPSTRISPYGRPVAPLDLARARQRAGAGLRRGAELELVGHDARFHLERAHREVELVEIELGAGEFDDAAGASARRACLRTSRLASKWPLARSMAGKYSVRKPSSPVAICSCPRMRPVHDVGGDAVGTQRARRSGRAARRRAAARRSAVTGSAFSVTKPEPKLMTSVRPLASLCRMAASTRSTRASPTNGAPPVRARAGRGVHGSLVFDIAA